MRRMEVKPVALVGSATMLALTFVLFGQVRTTTAAACDAPAPRHGTVVPEPTHGMLRPTGVPTYPDSG